MRATRALVHLENFKANVLSIKNLLPPKTLLCASVKADAYGHGALQCAKKALEAGATYLSVATVDEGRELREAGITCPLLMLSLCSPDEVAEAVTLELTPFVFDTEYASLFNSSCAAQGKRDYPVHLAVDTGMGRIGCRPDQARDVARELCKLSHLCLEGVATHFAMSDCTDERGRVYTKEQLARFSLAIDDIKRSGIDPGICHAANSAAALALPEARLDMVRAGIWMYGCLAGDISPSYLATRGTNVALLPVMTVQTEISCIKAFKKGESVGYGCTWSAPTDTNIAVLPIGYADGWLRRFSTCGVKVSCMGKSYPLVGRICMDQCMIDLGQSDLPPRGSTVTLFGSPQDGASQTADDVARLVGTISYEITCGISKRVPRIYVD